jgi:CubicO group peptidase (beta-lactamase class C family)
MIRSFSFVALALLISIPQAARADASFPEQASAMLSSVYAADAPGAAIVVSRNGEVIYERAFGLADVELDVSMEPDHVFRLASVTKQYAAAALLKLVEDGRVSLDDPLSKFLPDYPVGEVTITQLLNHTSGIKSYTGIEGYMDSERIRADLSTEELIVVFADEPVDFAPGEAWSYNNSGYVLVGAVIEAVTEQPWNDYLRAALLLPNGIEKTDAYADFAIVPGRVQGYDGPADEPQRAPYLSMTQPHAAGALMATAGDVDRWQVALHNGRILGDAIYQRMITPEGAAEEADYGFGITRQQWFGQTALSHGGGIFGFQTHALYLPEEKLSVVVLANRVGPGWGAQDVSLRLAGLATGKRYPIDDDPVDWSDAQRAQLQGTYRINDEEVRTIRVVDGELISQRNGGPTFDVYPIAGDRLAFETSLSAFLIERNEAGDVVAIALQSPWGGEPERAEKISDEVQVRDVVDVPVEQLERLVGDYELMPNFVLTVRVVDGGLEVQATGQPAIGMQAESPVRFFNAQVGATIEFELPETGVATALTLLQGGQEIPGPRITKLDDSD